MHGCDIQDFMLACACSQNSVLRHRKYTMQECAESHALPGTFDEANLYLRLYKLPMASDLAINATGVHKKYGRGRKAKHVLKGLNMQVPYNTM